MKNKTISVPGNRSWGDVAVDGLWPGVAGGLVMMAYLTLATLLMGKEPLTLFGYFRPDESWPPLIGLVTHLAVSAVHGTVFGLVSAVIGRRRPKVVPWWAIGIGYGLILWLIAVVIIIPSGLSGIGQIAPLHFLIAHVLYGGVMGWILGNSR